MRALLRALLAVVGVLGLVMVAAVIYVTTFFDPNDLKPRLIQVVRDQSGLELALEGPLSWSFYPRLGVSVSEAEAWLSEQTPEEAPFVAFDQAEVSLAFAPLLRGMIAIEGLTLDGMRLNLERDAEGHGNWEALLERLDGEEAAEQALAPAAAGVAPEEAGMAVALNIASVQLRGGRISYVDRRQDLRLQAEAVQVTGTQVNPSRAFPLRGGFTLRTYPEGQEAPRYASEVGFDGRVRLGLGDGRYRLEDASLTTRTELAELDGHRQRVDLSLAELVAEPALGRYRAEGGRLELGLSHPRLGETELPLSLAFVADADLRGQEVMLRELELEGPDGLRLSGNLTASQLFEAPQYTGQVSLAPLSLRPWLSRFDALPVTRDADVLTDVALTSPLRGDPSRLELTNLTLILDGATFTGHLGGQTDGSALSFDLQGDRLDLDRYLPPETAPEEAQASLPGIAAAQAQAEDDAAGALSLEWLQGLDLDGRLALGQLRVFALELDEVRLGVGGEGRRHRLESLEARLYDGTLEASGGLDQGETPVRWTLTPRLERVRVAPVYEALLEEASPLRGRLNLEGELTTRGDRPARWSSHLNGRLALDIEDGAMLDVNVSRQMCELVAALEGEQSQRQWSDETRFERAQAVLVIRDGVVHNDDLDIAVPGIALGGQGELNLVTRRFDYAARARFVDTADAACTVNPRLERVPLPVRCTGSLDDASGDWCRFDRQAFQDAVAGLLRDEAADRVSREVERRLDEATQGLEERFGEGAGEELRDTLRGLFD